MIYRLVVLLISGLLATCSYGQQFNFEIEKRILERLEFYLGSPIDTNKVIEKFRNNGGFPHSMDAQDRDMFLSLAYSVPQPLVYYGLEDGTIPGYYGSNAYYREPGNAGYNIENEIMQKHLNSCVDKGTGEPVKCLLPPGSDYISCRDGLGDESGLCEMIQLCPNQPTCDRHDAHCLADLKWCRQYDIVQAPSDVEQTDLGFIPLTNFCHNDKGQLSQEPGQVIDPRVGDRNTIERTNCTFEDGTLVERRLAGAYAACGNGSVCDTVFAGGYESNEYDPRYRPWYIQTKEKQKPIWLPPYPFFSLAIGITYTEPIYSNDEATGREIFAGVLAVDYRLEDIESFLLGSYGNSSTAIVIYEDSKPNYMIGTSTGSATARFVLDSDPKKPCPVDRGDNVPCSPVRLPVFELDGHPLDAVLVNAAHRHSEAGYPKSLLTVKASDDIDAQIFVSQSTMYTQPDAELAWRVIIVMPGAVSDSDSITMGDSLFVVICVVGALGVVICSLFFYVMYTNREKKAVVLADWRFTCAFIFGCILLNFATFTLLGKNTNTTCLLRLWTFHLFFALALSPLFVKIWRIKQLVGSPRVRRTSITNAQAALYTLPMILGQVMLLLVFTFVDPPKQTEVVDNDGGVVVQHIVCATESQALFITLASFETFFVVVGCVLAYMTRNLQNDFGESKQLIFSMYNIAFVGVIVVLVVKIAGLDGNGETIMQAVGVFWGTVFSTGAFVIPRLLQVQHAQRQIRNGYTPSVRVSGLLPPPSTRFVMSMTPNHGFSSGGYSSRDETASVEFDGQNSGHPEKYISSNTWPSKSLESRCSLDQIAEDDELLALEESERSSNCQKQQVPEQISAQHGPCSEADELDSAEESDEKSEMMTQSQKQGVPEQISNEDVGNAATKNGPCYEPESPTPDSPPATRLDWAGELRPSCSNLDEELGEGASSEGKSPDPNQFFC